MQNSVLKNFVKAIHLQDPKRDKGLSSSYISCCSEWNWLRFISHDRLITVMNLTTKDGKFHEQLNSCQLFKMVFVLRN